MRQRDVEIGVRIALGQRGLEQGAGRGEPGEARRIEHQARRERHLELAGDRSELLG